MVARNLFEEQLKDLKMNLLKMSGLVERVLDDGIKSLEQRDIEVAKRVVQEDDEINQLEKVVENEALQLIATQQPVAKDLRKIIAAIKISSELERMGDLSVDIAQTTLRLQGQELIKPLVDIPRMAKIAQEMVRLSIDSYVTENVDIAWSLADMDHEVDGLFSKVVRELHVIGSADPKSVDQTTALAFVARYIERIGDHATNIGENVIYLVTGKKPDLNQ